MECAAREGESPVRLGIRLQIYYTLSESRCLGVQRKVGGRFHLRLNIGKRPIANKYREGKMKRTPKGE